MVGRQTDADLTRLRSHFEIERELADRLRNAPREERRRLYGEVYGELFRRVELPGNRAAQRAQVELLQRLLAPFLVGCRSFLEIGAGNADLGRAIATSVERVWAVDAFDPEIEAAGAPTGFCFVLDRDMDSVVPEGGVDLAVSCHFVEHLHPGDLGEHLDLVLSRLRPGGVYVIVTPNRIYGPHDISRHFSPVPVGLHLREYCHFDLAAALEASGYERVGVIGAIGSLPSRGVPPRIAVVERCIDRLPTGLRRRLVGLAPRQAPFRPLEQVKVAGARPGGGP